MKNVPKRIYLNLGDIGEDNSNDFNELSEVTWSDSKIDDLDIMYLESVFPVFDLLEEHLREGASIALQDDNWFLFDSEGNSIAGGKTMREMLINLILGE